MSVSAYTLNFMALVLNLLILYFLYCYEVTKLILLFSFLQIFYNFDLMKTKILI